MSPINTGKISGKVDEKVGGSMKKRQMFCSILICMLFTLLITGCDKDYQPTLRQQTPMRRKNTGNVLLAILGAVAVGAVVGAVNGTLCAVGKLPGFIASLASMTILRGLAYIVTGGNSVVWRKKRLQ